MSYRWLTALALILLVGALAIAAAGPVPQTGTGRAHFLVAARDLPDPLFKESVVVMLPFANTDVFVGLIVNKRSRIPLSEVFSKDSALKNRSDPVYFGGPIATDMPSALFRSSKPFKQAVHIAGDLYVSFDSGFIEGLLKKPKQVIELRLFLGRAQWAPAQLQGEMALGAWYSEQEENAWIFSPQPENVWRTLIAQEEPGPRAQLDIPRVSDLAAGTSTGPSTIMIADRH